MYGLYLHKNQYAALSGFVHMVLVVPYCLTHSHRSFGIDLKENHKKIMPDSLNFISWRLKKLMCTRILDIFFFKRKNSDYHWHREEVDH